MTYAIDPAMSFAKLFLSMRNISTRQKPLEKTCIFPAFSHRQILKAG